MRIILLLLSIFALPASATDINLRQVYLDFESAYMSNDADRFAAWIATDYEIRQTLHIPGLDPEYRPVTKEQLIASMRIIDKPSSLPRSFIDHVTIESRTNTRFCGASVTISLTSARDKDYEEREQRKVCFRSENGWYLAVEHTIDVYYKELQVPDNQTK